MKFKKIFLFSFIFLLCSSVIFSQNNTLLSERDNKEKNNIEHNLSESNPVKEEFNRTWGGPEAECAQKIALDSLGNIYLAGFTNTTGGQIIGGDIRADGDMCLVKFNDLGEYQWNNTWGGSGNNAAGASGIALDSSDNIYLAGVTNNTIGGENDMCLVKFNNLGEYQWNSTFGGNEDEGAYGIALDFSDNIYLAGYTNDTIGGEKDMILVKFNDLGEYQWNSTFRGNENMDIATSIALDSSDNIYLAGGVPIDAVGGEKDMILVKFNDLGEYQWNSTFGGNEHEGAYGIALDSSDNIYLAGYTYDTIGGDSDMCLVKFNNLGEYQWNSTFRGNENMDIATSIALDSSDNIYLAGFTIGGDSDMCLVKFNNLGEYQWNHTWGGNEFDYYSGIVLDSLDNIYLAGTWDFYGVNPDMCLIKFNFTIVSGENVPPDAPFNPIPSDGATGVSTSPTLSVDVTDPDGDTMGVYFYNASNDSLIGTDTTVVDGGTASITWSDLSEGTTYSWYAIADDGTDTTQSSIWSFTTVSLPNNPPNQATSVSQLKSDGITPISEGGTTDESTIVFKGTISDPDGDDVRLEIELREIDQPFTGAPTPETISDLVPSGTEVTITRYELEPGEYHWQYRARDSKDASSEWEEYGSDGNIDFTVNLSIDQPPSLESFLSKTKIFSAFGHSITLNLSLFSNTTHNNEVLSDWNVESDEGYDLKFGFMLEVYNLRSELESLSVPQFLLDFCDLIISDDDAIRFLITANVISGYDKSLDEFILDVKDIVEPLLPIFFNPKNKISVPVSARWFFDNPIVEQWFHITKGSNQYDLKLKGSKVDNPIMAILNVLDIFFRIDYQLLTYQGGEVIPAKIGSHDLISAGSFAFDIIKLCTKAVRIAGTAGADLLAWGQALGTSYCLFHKFIFDPPMILKTILDSVFPGLHDTIYDIFDEMEDISNWIYVGASFLDPPAARLDLALFDNESNLLLGYDPDSNSTIQSSEQGFVVGDQHAQFMLIYNNSNEVYDLKVINSDLDGVDNSHLNYSIILKQIGSNKTFHSEGYLREGESTSTLLQIPTESQQFSVNTLEITLLSKKYPKIQIWISDQNNNSVEIDNIEMYLNGEEISFEFKYEGNGIYMLSDFASSYNENETFLIIVKKDEYFMNLLSVNFSPTTGDYEIPSYPFMIFMAITVIAMLGLVLYYQKRINSEKDKRYGLLIKVTF